VSHPSLHESISHVLSTRDVWLNLKKPFTQINAPQIHKLSHTNFFVGQKLWKDCD